MRPQDTSYQRNISLNDTAKSPARHHRTGLLPKGLTANTLDLRRLTAFGAPSKPIT
ncbi:hypothetical protein HMPREF0972_00420 [Actinomyces sp. oral taxon 848 str. F0332]|nr:hypothetical protein HMPREF0972_00420 [Actinomyces sp. oral taxon 848 str. F0332]